MQGALKESNRTNPLKELLVGEFRDLLHAEGQLVQALPKMAEAAHHPKLKEAFQKHLKQTGGHVERLKHAFELLGEDAQPKPCKAMMGLIEEGKETIEEGEDQQRSSPISASSPPLKESNITRFQDTELHEAWPAKSANAALPRSSGTHSARKRDRTIY